MVDYSFYTSAGCESTVVDSDDILLLQFSYLLKRFLSLLVSWLSLKVCWLWGVARKSLV